MIDATSCRVMAALVLVKEKAIEPVDCDEPHSAFHPHFSAHSHTRSFLPMLEAIERVLFSQIT